MAIDTERKRLDALAKRAGGRKLWGPTWTETSRLRAGASSARTRPRFPGGIAPYLVIGAAALFWFREPLGLEPMFVAAADRIYGAGLPGCESLASRYDRAISGIGGPLADGTRSSFSRAQVGCSREASAMSSGRAYACRTAAEHFGRALERRRTLASLPTHSGHGTIGVSAAGITTGDDGSSEESIARSLLAECRG